MVNFWTEIFQVKEKLVLIQKQRKKERKNREKKLLKLTIENRTATPDSRYMLHLLLLKALESGSEKITLAQSVCKRKCTHLRPVIEKASYLVAYLPNF